MLPLRIRRGLNALTLALSFAWTPSALAQVYNGCGIFCGIAAGGGIAGLSTSTSVSELILKIITFLLDIALLLAVLAIIIAGLYLITSNGDEGQKDKAKKIIFYALLGIVLILFSRAIVMLVNSIFF